MKKSLEERAKGFTEMLGKAAKNVAKKEAMIKNKKRRRGGE